MYLNSGVDYYLVVLHDIVIRCKSGLSIKSPNIKFKLLSYPDVSKILTMISSGMHLNDVNEEICKKCIEGIIGFPNEEIDLDESPAGITDHIGQKIYLNSKKILDDVEEAYTVFANNVILVEQLCMAISYYSSTPYDIVKEYPVDKIFNQYAICSKIFPVPPIVLEEEVEGKVGG